MSESPDVLFVHNVDIPYRRPFFAELAERHDVSYLFTHEDEPVDYVPSAVAVTYFGIAFGVVPTLLRAEYDVLVVSGWSDATEFVEGILCLLVGTARGKQCLVWTEHWYPPIFDPRRILAAPLFRLIIALSDAHVVPGQKSRELCLRMGADERDVFVAPNASTLELNTAKGGGTTVKDGGTSLDFGDKKVILYLSRIVPYKGLDYLIRAFSTLEAERDDVVLLVGGDGPFRSSCEALCNRLGVENVRFDGYVPDEEKPRYFEAADVFVLPTAFVDRHAEAWGLVVNEAMSVATPVVSTTAVAAAFDVIENDRNGYRVEEGNVEELADAIDRVLSDPETTRKMGREARHTVETRFTYGDMVDGFVDAIDYTSDSVADERCRERKTAT